MSTETIKTRAKEIGNMPAFPCTSDQFALGDRGITYRQWLVGMALQGLLAHHGEASMSGIYDYAVKQAFTFADATLTALAESEVQNG